VVVHLKHMHRANMHTFPTQTHNPAAAETEEQLARASGGGGKEEYDKKAAKLEDRCECSADVNSKPAFFSPLTCARDVSFFDHHEI
jgi:hypothetical protein